MTKPAEKSQKGMAGAHSGAASHAADLESARRVLKLEADGIASLSDLLNGAFIEALDVMDRCKGRVVVTGIGKSGHIARKLAATLASTGTPAQFVHPGEANHGDLGMIVPEDVVLALSNSGETVELSGMVAHSRRHDVPLIAITSNPKSALASNADVVLLLPKAKEACPMGLAPTTSTTAMLALGDALAVALLERKGFSADDFHRLHPGGRLGRQLLKVADIMHTGDAIPQVDGNEIMSEALLEMTQKSFGCVGVLDERGALAGVITDGDLRRHLQPNSENASFLALKAKEVMTPDPKSIRPKALAVEALRIMNANAITSLFVIDDNAQLVGLIHVHDCLREGLS